MSRKLSSRPSHLKGRELGLWYAAQSKANKIKNEQILNLSIVGLNFQKIETVIEKFLGPREKSLTDNNSALSEFSKKIHITNECRNNSEDTDETVCELEEVFDVPFGSDLKADQTFSADILQSNSVMDREMHNNFKELNKTSNYKSMLHFRSTLPIYSVKDEILSLIFQNQFVVISGETGCGKTTQIPQYILENQILNFKGSQTRIVVTQPRRLSAISVSHRVASELCQNLGLQVGYQIRLESKHPKQPQGSILFCTTGILLEWFKSDPFLKGVSHIVVDEVHEREVLCDFLLCMLKRITPYRPDLRIIIMSATINSDRFVEYFNNCPKFHVDGRLFPVKSFYLEDVLKQTEFWLPSSQLDTFCREQSKIASRQNRQNGLNKKQSWSLTHQKNNDLQRWLHSQPDLSPVAMKILEAIGENSYPDTNLIVTTIDYIFETTKSGAILVFVSGLGEIKSIIQNLKLFNPSRYGPQSKVTKIYPLHSRLSVVHDPSLFAPSKHGVRKIIVATNIAETSITIQDVVYVIDSGRVKLLNYNSKQNSLTLAPVLVSKANAAQRRGRAGRVQPGICYHLFSSFVYDNKMIDFISPEMLRIRLEDVILRIKLLELGSVISFLSDCLDSPSQEAVAQTLIFLRKIQALKHVASLGPTDIIHSPSSKNPISSRSGRHKLKQFCKDAKDEFNASHNVTEQLPIAHNTSVDLDRTEDDYVLTPLGVHLANLPLDPQCAKLLLLGALFGCLEPALATASCLTNREPFDIPLDREMQAERARMELADQSFSDHWVYVAAVQKYRVLNSLWERQQFCNRYCINENAMKHNLALMENYAQLLYERGYIGSSNPYDEASNRNRSNMSLLRAILCAALYPNIISVTPQIKKGFPVTPSFKLSDGSIKLHSKCVNANIRTTEPLWMVYFNKTILENDTRPTVFETSIITMRPLLFFAGDIKLFKENSDVYIIDDWIKFRAEPKVVNLIQDLRRCLDKLLEDKFKNPSTINWNKDDQDGCLIRTISNLFISELPPQVEIAQKNRGNASSNSDSKRIKP